MVRVIKSVFFPAVILFQLSCFGGAVLWDTTRITSGAAAANYKPSSSGGYYKSLVNDMNAKGIAINQWSGGLINKNLDTVDVAVISSFCSSGSAYSAEEINKLGDFVSAGGGLLLLGDQHSSYLNTQGVAGRFGMSFMGTSLTPADVAITDLQASHPIFKNINSLYMYAATGVSGGTPIAYQDMTRAPLISSTFYGKGRVIAIGDNSLWQADQYVSNYTKADNALFAKNVFTYLGDKTIIPEPTTLLLLAAGFFCLRKPTQS